jgi:hypothetical protein
MRKKISTAPFSASNQVRTDLSPRRSQSARSLVTNIEPFVTFVFSFENCGWGEEMRLPRPSPPNVLIGGPVRISPGFPLKACGNDGLVGELGVEGHTPFSSSVGERKIMNHFVV